MAVLQDFSTFFNTFKTPVIPDDYRAFWSAAYRDLKKISLETQLHDNKRMSNSKFRVMDVSFRSFQKVTVYGKLWLPKDGQKKRPIIVLHDYNRYDQYAECTPSADCAYLFMTLRGHHVKPVAPDPQSKAPVTPGYVLEGITEPANCYLLGAALDVLRAIDVLRLQNDIDTTNIGIMGTGLGATIAAICSVLCDRICALAVDSPALTDIESYQNNSKSDLSNEINSYIASRKSVKTQIKNTLAYFDILCCTPQISVPVMMSIGLQDKMSPPKCSMNFFNLLQCDKTAEIYPAEGNFPSEKEQFRKNLEWMMPFLYP